MIPKRTEKRKQALRLTTFALPPTLLCFGFLNVLEAVQVGGNVSVSVDCGGSAVRWRWCVCVCVARACLSGQAWLQGVGEEQYQVDRFWWSQVATCRVIQSRGGQLWIGPNSQYFRFCRSHGRCHIDSALSTALLMRKQPPTVSKQMEKAVFNKTLFRCCAQFNPAMFNVSSLVERVARRGTQTLFHDV